MGSPARRKKVAATLVWLLSLLIHLAFFVVLNRNWIARERAHDNSPVEITITEIAPKKTAQNSSAGPMATKHHGNKGAAWRGLHLVDLLPGPSTAKFKSDDEETMEGPQAILSFGDGNKQLGLYNYIYRILEPHVIFPEELRTRGIQGMVTATVIFSPDGEYLRSASTFNASNNYIKVLVLKTLRETFKEKLNSNFLKERKRIEIRCHFEYAITEHNDQLLVASRNYVAGNNLRYFRHYQDSKLSWQVGPIHGWGIFPAVDLGWFAKLAEKKEPDPLIFYTQDPEW